MLDAMINPAADHDEEAIAALLSELREPPRAWIEAAKELPRARLQIAGIVERAETDVEFRDQVLADLERALMDEGHEPAPHLLAALKVGIKHPEPRN